MSTLTISIIALVAFVVGAVLLFNLWQSWGTRRLRRDADDDIADAFDAPGTRTGRDAAGWHPDAQGRAEPRHRQHGTDGNDWARQRREPTLLAEDEAIPAALTASRASHLHEDFTSAEAARGFRAEAPLGRADAPLGPHEERLADPEEDLGPPQFEAPHLDSTRLESSLREPARSDAGWLEHPASAQPGMAGARAGSGKPRDAVRAGGAGGAAVGVAGDAFEDTPEPGAPPWGHGAQAPDAPAAAAGPATDVPAEVDHTVTLVPRTPVNAERLVALTSSLRHVGCKAVRIEIDGGRGTWVPLQSGSMVGRLRCSVLLANRQGPLNAVELSDFSGAVEALAGQIGARFTAPDMNQVMRRARELDAVAARLDTQVDLGVEASAPITAQKLASIARKLDLFDRGGGRFACFAEGGELLYTLSAGQSADLLAFVLDVPRTAEEHEPWRSMVACAGSCAQLVGGRVIDSTGRGMSVGMIDSVGVQIHKRYRELAEAGLRAGSQAALRVFN